MRRPIESALYTCVSRSRNAAQVFVDRESLARDDEAAALDELARRAQRDGGKVAASSHLRESRRGSRAQAKRPTRPMSLAHRYASREGRLEALWQQRFVESQAIRRRVLRRWNADYQVAMYQQQVDHPGRSSTRWAQRIFRISASFFGISASLCDTTRSARAPREISLSPSGKSNAFALFTQRVDRVMMSMEASMGRRQSGRTVSLLPGQRENAAEQARTGILRTFVAQLRSEYPHLWPEQTTPGIRSTSGRWPDCWELHPGFVRQLQFLLGLAH